MVVRRVNAIDRTVNMHRQDLLQVAEVVAREKGIEKEEVLQALEQAIQRAAKARYGFEKDIRATVDPHTGEIMLDKCLEVVEVIGNPETQIVLEEAKHLIQDIQVGDLLMEQLPPIDFGRVAAQAARQVIMQKVREAERSHQYEDFKDKNNTIVSGLVKQIEFGNAIVDLGRAEGILRREDMIPREIFRVGDRIRAYIFDVRPDARGPMVMLSRTHPQFMHKLFEQEVPEIYDGVIEVKSVARDPGSRAKMAVYTADPSLDPVGACVGLRGARVQAIVTELQGEKVDIVPWSADPATFVVNALAPAEVVKVVMDEETNRVDIVVSEEQLSLAIGRRGQNVRLASQLTGMRIDIITENQEAERRMAEYQSRTELFMTALDVDEVIAQLLASEGFMSVVELTFTPLEELIAIEGFDETIAQEIQSRAIMYLERTTLETIDKAKALGVSEDILELEGITADMFLKIGESGIRTLDDFADLSGDELLEILNDPNLSIDQANTMIMAARAHWFAGDDATQKTAKN